MKRFHQFLLISATLGSSWLSMQAIHELGHVLGAVATRAQVKRVVLNPLSISRTDVGENPNPLFVVWAGPLIGVILPLILWGLVQLLKFRSAFVFRFFAGFCLIANGAYIAYGSFDQIGDCKEMLSHGSKFETLWLFGAISVPIGMWLWHGQGGNFGLGPHRKEIEPYPAYATLIFCLTLVFLGFVFGRAEGR
jgi:hypothetical protein